MMHLSKQRHATCAAASHLKTMIKVKIQFSRFIFKSHLFSCHNISFDLIYLFKKTDELVCSHRAKIPNTIAFLRESFVYCRLDEGKGVTISKYSIYLDETVMEDNKANWDGFTRKFPIIYPQNGSSRLLVRHFCKFFFRMIYEQIWAVYSPFYLQCYFSAQAKMMAA